MIESLAVGVFGVVVFGIQVAILIYLLSLLRRTAEGVERIEDLLERNLTAPRWPPEDTPEPRG